MTERVLEGRAAWVTGGASGMGRAIAIALAVAGADVAVGSLLAAGGTTRPRDLDTYFPTEAELEEVHGTLASQGVRVLARALDVRSDEDVQAFYDDASALLGKIDILVNAAGIDAQHRIVAHPDEVWHRVIDTNLHGNYRTIKRCLPGMIERGFGRIVIIASTAASVGSPTNAAYCASKSALLGLMRCVALEGAPYGVTCNAISPGFVDTPMAETFFRHAVERGEAPSLAAARAQAMKSYPQGAFMQPRDIASLVAYLCSDVAARITMEDLRVSGGALW
jgi:NAD(P)-dependent dehydrogenase (short-subunit alcohol dehydrogenase family)